MKSTWLILGLITVATGSANAQDMQGFDPNAPAVPDFKLTPFYDANLDFAGKQPGDILKTESVQAPEGAVAWRVMYVSRTWDDRLVPVTGLIVAPKETGSAPRPILNWAQGTTGGARVCAPSLDDNPAQNLVQRSDTAPIDYGVPYLTDFLARGFVVVASDYYGLGGPGVHQFLVGTTAARNGLDIARAARSMKDLNAGVDLLTFGWSQGGQAAIFTGEEQPGYAPELAHRGVVAIAPGTSFPHFMEIPHIYVFARAFNSAYYASLDGFTEDGKALIAAADKTCITGVFRESTKLKGPFFAGELTDDPAMAKALELNEPGRHKSGAPILVVHGTADNVVAPEFTEALLPRACESGDTIKVSWYPDKDHRTVIAEGQTEILAWFGDRMLDRGRVDRLPGKIALEFVSPGTGGPVAKGDTVSALGT